MALPTNWEQADTWLPDFKRIARRKDIVFYGLHVDPADPKAERYERDKRVATLEYGVEKVHNQPGERGTLTVPVRVRNGVTDRKYKPDGSDFFVRDEPYEPKSGFWYLRYVDLVNTVRLLGPAPPQSWLWFEIILDEYQNDLVVSADLHMDALRLCSNLSRAPAKVLIDMQIGRHNSARFGEGK